ncbi:MAG: hypothetical protein LBH28_02535 [Oscillospiraceae bacterium]|jgi:hypothetical protein|nr:hypothetical protein [Oscillospiraceae bacterium]
MGMLYALVPIIFIGSPIVLGLVGVSSDKNRRPLLTAAAVTLCAGLILTAILCFSLKFAPQTATDIDVIDLFF